MPEQRAGVRQDEAAVQAHDDAASASSVTKMVDPYFVGKYREKLGEIRGAIRELEEVVDPIRRAVDAAERRLAILRDDEAAYLEALDDD